LTSSRGKAFQTQGKRAWALWFFQCATQFDPNDDADARSNKDAALSGLRRYDEALEDFDRALALEHKDKYGWDGRLEIARPRQETSKWFRR
jgi:tetratricopeptide (TPR) repeat protein